MSGYWIFFLTDSEINLLNSYDVELAVTHYYTDTVSAQWITLSDYFYGFEYNRALRIEYWFETYKLCFQGMILYRALDKIRII